MSFACTLFSGIAIGLILGLAMRSTRVQPGAARLDAETVDYGELAESEAETEVP